MDTVTYLTPKLKEGETVNLEDYNPRQRTNIRLYGLSCKDWTPQDVFDYKRSWISKGYEEIKVRNIRAAKDWCSKNLFLQDWDLKMWHYPDDSHVIRFKNAEEAMLFKLAFGE